MKELQEIRENLQIDQTLLTVDAMTGQDAVNVATAFEEKIGIDGVNPDEAGRRYKRRPRRCLSRR